MTAFDNIKTNNWPAASNNLEDFLVLKLPLNDQASLTESLPVNAGSTVLHPKRTLTNTGVSMEAFDPNAGTTINIAASEYSTSGTVSNVGNLFDGDTSTTVSSADGARIYWTPASSISVTKFEVYFSSQYSGYKIGVEVTGGSSQVITKSNPGNSPGWVEFTSIAGDTIGPSNQIKFRSYRSNDTDPGILGINAVRVNNKIVTTAAAGVAKKHYDDNAVFNGSAFLGTTSSSSAFTFGTDDFTIEYWTNYNDISSGNSQCGDFQTSTTLGGINTLYTTGVHNYFYPAGQLNCTITGSSGGSISGLATGIWYHIACVRENGSVRLYKDGVLQDTTTNTGNVTATHIGIGGYYTAAYLRNGPLQDFRVYKGIAKYTTNFTPPPAILG